jgi:N-dimethylarginine dimethylaminohydrolase
MWWTNHVLMCKPDFYDVSYRINPWMDGPPLSHEDRTKALQQWLHLHHTVIRCGGYVKYIEQAEGLPDMVFTANGALVHGRKVVIPRFAKPERMKEEKFFREWFRNEGYEVLILSLAGDRFEGNGDSFVFRDTLYLGVGDRTSPTVAGRILDFFGLRKVILCELVDPRFYHLDTCFCPLDGSDVLWYPAAFSEATRTAIRNERLNLIEVSQEDALKFACNSVSLGKNVIMPCSSKEITQRLTTSAYGYKVTDVCVDQFMRAGGASKCLTLKV